MPVGLQNTDLRKPQIGSRRQFFAGGAVFAAVGGRTIGGCAGACARTKRAESEREISVVSAAEATPHTDPQATTTATHNNELCHFNMDSSLKLRGIEAGNPSELRIPPASRVAEYTIQVGRQFVLGQMLRRSGMSENTVSWTVRRSSPRTLIRGGL